ncbi:DUF4258 domain-containing protein [Croceivirga thetidis]|uniref:DUF4258 domain-containing protein n=1 Tax=Croceivirga thetidis TaxID=2721623 RepID=A0ABX1GTI2_9FLAO|nr:DUF4258 domain-containing protein [Croceivirga thetidis]NKI32220.1 DUF4258 domain-containing protein [Croceivirga thetidis]
MAGFFKRLGWYLIGFSIGIIFLVFFLKKKSGGEGVDFCYLPNCRVLKDIRNKPLNFDAFEKDSTLIKTMLNEGNIDFSKSDTSSETCNTYWIDYESTSLEIKNCKDSSEVLKLHY